MAFPEAMKDRAREQHGALVFPEGQDERILHAANRLLAEGVAERIFVVDPASSGEEEGFVPVDSEDSQWKESVNSYLRDSFDDPEEAEAILDDPLYQGVGLVALGEADGMVAGATHPTADVLRSALTVVGTRPGEDVVSSSFVMDVQDSRFGHEGSLIFSDPAVLPSPEPEELVDVASGAVRTYEHLVGGEAPRVAFLSFSTRGSADHEDVDRVREAADRFAECHPDVDSDGELQADAALVEDVAERKAPDSSVAGEANILIFPDLDAANIGYKLVQWLGNAGAYGPFLQGLGGVVNDLSRGCSVEDVMTVGAVSLVQGTASEK
jgi:phosphate acetyltransferase